MKSRSTNKNVGVLANRQKSEKNIRVTIESWALIVSAVTSLAAAFIAAVSAYVTYQQKEIAIVALNKSQIYSVSQSIEDSVIEYCYTLQLPGSPHRGENRISEIFKVNDLNRFPDEEYEDLIDFQINKRKKLEIDIHKYFMFWLVLDQKYSTTKLYAMDELIQYGFSNSSNYKLLSDDTLHIDKRKSSLEKWTLYYFNLQKYYERSKSCNEFTFTFLINATSEHPRTSIAEIAARQGSVEMLTPTFVETADGISKESFQRFSR